MAYPKPKEDEDEEIKNTLFSKTVKGTEKSESASIVAIIKKNLKKDFSNYLSFSWLQGGTFSYGLKIIEEYSGGTKIYKNHTFNFLFKFLYSN